MTGRSKAFMLAPSSGLVVLVTWVVWLSSACSEGVQPNSPSAVDGPTVSTVATIESYQDAESILGFDLIVPTVKPAGTHLTEFVNVHYTSGEPFKAVFALTPVEPDSSTSLSVAI